MRLDEVMHRLYQAEINCHVSCFWDGGWDVKLGDPQNGYKAETCVDSPQEAGEWLWQQALRHYPVMGFVEWVAGGCSFRGMSTDDLERMADSCHDYETMVREQIKMRRARPRVTRTITRVRIADE